MLRMLRAGIYWGVRTWQARSTTGHMKRTSRPCTAMVAIRLSGVPLASFISRSISTVTPSMPIRGQFASTLTYLRSGSILAVCTRAVTTRSRMLSMPMHVLRNSTQVTLPSLKGWRCSRTHRQQDRRYPQHLVRRTSTRQRTRTPCCTSLRASQARRSCCSLARLIDLSSAQTHVDLQSTICRFLRRLLSFQGVHRLVHSVGARHHQSSLTRVSARLRILH
jgi:hypothetical protein